MALCQCFFTVTEMELWETPGCRLGPQLLLMEVKVCIFPLKHLIHTIPLALVKTYILCFSDFDSLVHISKNLQYLFVLVCFILLSMMTVFSSIHITNGGFLLGFMAE